MQHQQEIVYTMDYQSPIAFSAYNTSDAPYCAALNTMDSIAAIAPHAVYRPKSAHRNSKTNSSFSMSSFITPSRTTSRETSARYLSGSQNQINARSSDAPEASQEADDSPPLPFLSSLRRTDSVSDTDARDTEAPWWCRCWGL